MKTTMFLSDVINLYGRDEVKNWFMNYNLEDHLFPEQITVINNAGFWTKERLANNILNRYFMREIGFETPAMFKLYVENEMELLMQEFLPLIYTTSIDYDLLVNVDFTETFNRNIEGNAENEGTTSSNSNGNSKGHAINNDTPQTNISYQKLEDGMYANNVNSTESDSTASGTTSAKNNGKTNQNETWSRNQKGNSGALTTSQALIKQYRDNIISVNNLILARLNKFFMILY